MAKKVRQPRSSSPRTYSQAGLQSGQSTLQPQASTANARQATSSAAGAAKVAQPVDLAVEYPYVGKELRRLGLTAVALIALEIVLGVMLR